ncbi:sirohydrochlorin chelatase [Salinicoccus sesuvii]|uniref:Sirohydrochlorin chelatase n=1 Tax=Salinicoccus sesuvii TaxID=868281 RepID=A0ABV7N8J6_9STAP
MERIIVLHGSKNEKRNDVLTERLAHLMGTVSDYSVAFVESRERGVDQVIEKRIEQGQSRFNIVPALFFSASHYCHDIPRAIEKVRESHNFEYTMAPVLSHHPFMKCLIEKRMSELPPDGAVIVMAHGNTEYEMADYEMKNLVSGMETDRSVFPAMLKGQLSVEGVLREVRKKHRVLCVVPIVLEDGFVTSKMKDAVMTHAEDLTVAFAPAINYDPILKEILLSHMKL